MTTQGLIITHLFTFYQDLKRMNNDSVIKGVVSLSGGEMSVRPATNSSLPVFSLSSWQWGESVTIKMATVGQLTELQKPVSDVAANYLIVELVKQTGLAELDLTDLLP